MKLLLDTHSLIWWLMDQPNLRSSALNELQDRSNQVLVSASVVWEIDPFDRMLIAQALVEKATIVTRDANFPLYGG